MLLFKPGTSSSFKNYSEVMIVEMNWQKFFTGMNGKRKIEALVFDFDGIIGDTEGLQMEKWNIILKPYGIQISLDQYAKNYGGKSSTEEIPLLLKREYGNRIPLSAEELGQQAGTILKDLFRNREVGLMPQARKTILFFVSFKLAVCSGRNPEELEMKLASVGMNKMFPKGYRSTQSEAGGFAKPHPSMYLLAVRRLGFKPEQCVAFEDTAAGVQSAADAGLFVIAMPNIYSEGQNFSRADVVIYGGWPAFFQEIQNSFSKNKGN
jgi:HAD superfamily hydrolase (TIGR01509 family)